MSSVSAVTLMPTSPEQKGTTPGVEHHPLLQRAEILGMREGGLVDCWVPTSLIDNEEVPVKEEWAKSLAKQIQRTADENGGVGQLTPITLGLIEGQPKLKIIDGFHRSGKEPAN